MARDGISYDQVAAAADALVGAGQKPSIRNVREALGTGSPNTVHRHLTAWRAAQPVAQGVAYELPADLANAFGRELARGAAAARAEVEAELVQAQSEAAELASTGEQLEAERDELATQVAALTTERDQSAATAAERAQEIARLLELVQREQRAAESARVELATARLKIESQDSQVDELRAALTAAQKELAEAQSGRQAAEQRAAVQDAKEAAERKRADDQDQRANRAEKRADELDKRVERAETQAREALRKEGEQRAAADAARAELKDAQEALKKAQQAEAEARRELDVICAQMVKVQPVSSDEEQPIGP